jgi:hypothetical protein
MHECITLLDAYKFRVSGHTNMTHTNMRYPQTHTKLNSLSSSVIQYISWLEQTVYRFPNALHQRPDQVDDQYSLQVPPE